MTTYCHVPTLLKHLLSLSLHPSWAGTTSTHLATALEQELPLILILLKCAIFVPVDRVSLRPANFLCNLCQ